MNLKAACLEKVNKCDKTLAKLVRKQERRKKMTNTRNERAGIITGAVALRSVIQEEREQLYANIFCGWDQRDELQAARV